MNIGQNNIDPAYFRHVVKYLSTLLPFTQEQAAILIKYCELRNFDKKVIIVEAGETDNYLNMVMSGLVRKYVRKGKNDVTLQLATEGHIVHSEISYLKRSPSLVVLETLEPTIMVSISHNNMEEMLDKMPGGERMGRLLLSAMYVKKDERHYKLLQLSTRQRFLEYMDKHCRMLQRVPQKYLASYLNIKPETFSRLKHLVKSKQ